MSYESLIADAVCYHKLQESSGLVAVDSAGGNHGTFTGMGSDPVSVTGPTAWLPRAVEFDGSNDYLVYDSQVGSLANWTIACWVKTAQTGNDRYLFSEGSTDSNDPVIAMVVQSGMLRGFCRTGIALNLITSVVIGDGGWHFIQFSRDGDNFALYCDGQLATSATSFVGQPATNISSVGCLRRSTAGLFTQATIAGAGKWARTLSLTDHQALFLGPSSSTPSLAHKRRLLSAYQHRTRSRRR